MKLEIVLAEIIQKIDRHEIKLNKLAGVEKPLPGAGGSHTILSATHTDSDTSTPNDQDVLTWDNATGKWKAIAPAGGTDPYAIHDNAAGEIHAITSKGTPVAADEMVIEDSAGGVWNKKRVTLSTIPGIHAPVTLAAGHDAALTLTGQELNLADVLTPTEHATIGNSSPHHAPVTLGAGNNAALALAGQELTLTLPVPASPWPVGAIFISVVSTDPATLLGYGTWAAFGAGRVLVGLDAGDPNFDVVEETGGAKTVQASAQSFAGDALGSHYHGIGTFAVPSHTGASAALGSSGTTRYFFSGSTDKAHSAITGSSEAKSAGTPSGTNTPGAATSVVQPYIVVYMWKRTA